MVNFESTFDFLPERVASPSNQLPEQDLNENVLRMRATSIVYVSKMMTDETEKSVVQFIVVFDVLV